MIPGTAIPTTRPQVDDTLTPARTSQKVSDALSDFQPGQRLVATIQSQLANGTYRAMIAQRDVTLALPFAAKAGDQLKLEVVDTRGRVAFALADDAPAAEGKQQGQASATTTLSQAGRIIGTLFAKPAPGAPPGAAAEPAPAPLNRGQPLSAPPVDNGAQLAPALQKAVSQSGLFFESHLAAWVTGKFAKAELLREPLAQLPRPAGEAMPRTGDFARGATTPTTPTTSSAPGTPAGPAAGTAPAAASAPTAQAQAAAGSARAAGNVAPAPAPVALPGGVSIEAGARAGAPAFTLPADAAPVVHQQLNALATNVYAFQAQAWADQRIHWEIVDEDGRSGRDGGDATREWRSRLSLTMPSLGRIEAIVRLRGDHLDIRFEVPRDDTRQSLNHAAATLRDRLTALGLKLDALRFDAPAAADESPAA